MDTLLFLRNPYILMPAFNISSQVCSIIMAQQVRQVPNFIILHIKA
jgi:hypothetical protein